MPATSSCSKSSNPGRPISASGGQSVFNLFYIVGLGITVPVSIFVARARGAQQPAEAGEYLRHGVALALMVGVAELLAMLVLSTQLERFGQPSEVLAIVRPFFLLFAGSIV